jgi:hypothetical protein
MSMRMWRRAHSSWAWGHPPVHSSAHVHLPVRITEVQVRGCRFARLHVAMNIPRIPLVARSNSHGFGGWKTQYCVNLRALQVLMDGAGREWYLSLQGSDEQSIEDLAGLV